MATNIKHQECTRIIYRRDEFENYIKTHSLKDEGFVKKILNAVNGYISKYEQEECFITDNKLSFNVSSCIEYEDAAYKLTRQNIHDRYWAKCGPVCSECMKEEYFYSVDSRTNEEMINDLGILYLLFGSTYVTNIRYHVYKMRLKKALDNDGSFAKVQIDLYEDDILICRNVVIEFWPFHIGDKLIGDVAWSIFDFRDFLKYENCADYLIKILSEMQFIWNVYLDEFGILSKGSRQLASYVESKALEQQYILGKEYFSEKIHEIEKDNSFYNLKKKIDKIDIENYIVKTSKQYQSLEDLLEETGVVYQIRRDGIYIWNCIYKHFTKLEKYEITKHGYILILIKNTSYYWYLKNRMGTV